MGTAYQPPNMASYENTHRSGLAGYTSSLAQVDRTRNALSDAQAALATNYPRPLQVPSQPLTTQLHQPHGRFVLSSSDPHPPQSNSRQSTRPSTPNSAVTLASQQEDGTSNRGSAMVLHSLEIPACISPKGGNLADFAAQVTCLFWFETVQTLKDAETTSPTKRIRRLHRNATASQAFKKWVQGILTTTQVTQNVILLGLLFIYRLKATNPGVKGRAGSEYRLLTVALMLGNKFLDDNTYTNKTWAEVSCITVKEIHVMEVEFLSNMRYSLLVSKGQWQDWLVKLSKFSEYCDRATMPHTSPLIIPSAQASFGSPLPSPTGHVLLTPGAHPSPPAASHFSPSTAMYGAGNASPWPAYPDATALSPLANKPDLKNTYGKRYLADDDPTEPPAKRMSRQAPALPPLPSQQLNQMLPAAATVPEPLRLPAPHLTLNTGQHMPTVAVAVTTPYSAPTATSYAPQTQSALSLPPLVPGVRAMATVYAATTTTFAPQPPLLATSGPSLPPSSAPSGAVTPTGYPTAAYGTPTKRMSPHNSLTPAVAYASSPMAESFAHVTGVHTPLSHSPSLYLQQRSSPYKPIRNFNTLLYPPPSASLHEYHIAGGIVAPTQMHYQPLGRRHEFRTGVVPEFQGVPFGGAVERGLALTPVHGVHIPMMPRGPGQTFQAPYPN